MNTKELSEIMTGVTPKEWLIKKPGEHATKNFRLVRPIGGSNNIFSAIAEISTSRSSEDNYSDKTERQRAEFLLRVAQNFEPLVLIAEKVARLRLGNGRLYFTGDPYRDVDLETLVMHAEVALNNALKP